KAAGGRRGLGMLYPNYMALERGRSLPKPWRLEAILKALNLSPTSPQGRELVNAYLVSSLGSDALLKGLEASPVASSAASEELARHALRLRSTQLELTQWRVLAADPAAYYCHVYLINTPGWSKESELAEALGLPAAKVRAALGALAGAKIVERSRGRARSPFAYKWVRTLPHLPATLNLKSAILRHREAFAGKKGTLEHRSN